MDIMSSTYLWPSLSASSYLSEVVVSLYVSSFILCICLIIDFHREIWSRQEKPRDFYYQYNRNFSQTIAHDLMLYC